MTAPPLQEGEFVWCAFPEREIPARPGPLHVAYVLAVARQVPSTAPPEYTALIAYTTSQPWLLPGLPLGVFVFDREAASGLGQARAFVMDLRRLAVVPVTLEWFPRLDQTDRGIEARMPKKQRLR